jgi:hypothetical protein
MVQKGYIREWSMRMGHSHGLFIVPFANGTVVVPTISPVMVTFANGTFVKYRSVYRKILGIGFEKRSGYRSDCRSDYRSVRECYGHKFI